MTAVAAAAFRAPVDAFNGRDPERLLAETETVAAELTERFTFPSAAKVAQIAGSYRFRDGLISRAPIYREGSADLAAG